MVQIGFGLALEKRIEYEQKIQQVNLHYTNKTSLEIFQEFCEKLLGPADDVAERDTVSKCKELLKGL